MSDDDFETPYPLVPESERPTRWLLYALRFSQNAVLVKKDDEEASLVTIEEFIDVTKQVCGHLQSEEAKSISSKMADPRYSYCLDQLASEASVLISNLACDGAMSVMSKYRMLAEVNRKLFNSPKLR